MQTINTIQSVLQSHKEQLRQRFGVTEMAIFGSFVRGNTHAHSDVDILVEFARTPDLLEFIATEQYLKKLLGRKVDLVRKTALRKELQPLLQNILLLWSER